MTAVEVSDGTPVALDVSAYPDLRETLQTAVVQNLGPDDLYLDYNDEVSAATGIKLVVGAIWEIQKYDSGRPIWMISSGESDVRVLAFD